MATKRSAVWEHFDINPCDESHATCKHCGSSVSRGAASWSTSTLMKHISRCHPCIDTSKKLNSDADSPGISSPRQQEIKCAFDRSRAWEFNDQRSLRLHRSVAEMIALDDQPFSVVQNEGFRRLMHLAEPRYTLPSDSYLRQTAIPNLHKHLREKVAEIMTDVKFVSFTTDTWTTSMSSESLISLTGHWVDYDWMRRSAVLQTSHMPGSHTAANITKKFDEMLTSWSLEDKVSVYTFIMYYCYSPAELWWNLALEYKVF